MTPLEKEYIEAQKANVRVESYDNIVMNKTFKGRTRTFLAGAAIGMGTGLAIGAVAALLPALVGVAAFETITAASVITASVIGGAAGAGIGMICGQIVGSSAGAAAGGLQEKERREKMDALEKELKTNPDLPRLAKQYAADKATGKIAEVPPLTPNTLGEVWERSTGVGDFLGNMVVWKTLVTTTAMGAVLGAVAGLAVSAGAGAPLLGPLLGKIGVEVPKLAAGQLMAANWPAITATTSAIFAIGAMPLGVNYPVIFTSAADFFGKVLSGKIFEKDPAPQLQQEKAPAPAKPAEFQMASITEEKTLGGQEFSYTEMVIKQQAAEIAGAGPTL